MKYGSLRERRAPGTPANDLRESSMSATKSRTGIEERHRKGCAKRDEGQRCTCKAPSYVATVYDAKTAKRLRKTFSGVGALTAAKLWRVDAAAALRAGTHESQRPVLATVSVQEACAQWARDARAGIVTTRSGDIYKPGAVRSYEQSLRLRVLDELGERRLHEIRRIDIQRLVNRLVVEGHAPPTVVGAVTAMRVVFNYAAQVGELEVSPVNGIKLPAVRSRRERFASPAEAVELLAALRLDDQAIWATALYAGLRRGEIMALRRGAINFKAGTIEVRQSWDIEHGPQETKSRNRRRVPIPSVLRESLLAHKLRQPPGRELVFGIAPNRPFAPSALTKRADTAWEEAGLERIGLHECRHTYASLMIAAGCNAKALSDYMGHASITTTFDRYGHLMPGNHEQAAELLDSYLTAATAQPTDA